MLKNIFILGLIAVSSVASSMGPIGLILGSLQNESSSSYCVIHKEQSTYDTDFPLILDRFEPLGVNQVTLNHLLCTVIPSQNSPVKSTVELHEVSSSGFSSKGWIKHTLDLTITERGFLTVKCLFSVNGQERVLMDKQWPLNFGTIYYVSVKIDEQDKLVFQCIRFVDFS